jgi:hypothetical protein
VVGRSTVLRMMTSNETLSGKARKQCQIESGVRKFVYVSSYWADVSVVVVVVVAGPVTTAAVPFSSLFFIPS